MTTSLIQLTRRDVLRLLAGGVVAGIAAPAMRATGWFAPVGPAGGFLTSEELATLDAVTSLIVPTDSLPGAHECGVTQYIQSMLSFLPGSDANCDRRVNAADVSATISQLGAIRHPSNCRESGDVNGDGTVDATDVDEAAVAVYAARPIFAGGPFSGRQPQPHFPTGTAPCAQCHGVLPQGNGGAAGVGGLAGSVENYPPNAFEEFLQPNRIKTMSWKIRILGAAAVPEAAANPLAMEMLETGQRQKYRAGLAQIESISQTKFGASFAKLTEGQQTTVFNEADPAFALLLTYHTVEGLLCAPEYGGNHDRLGWKLVGFDGDSQPLGYTIYDSATGQYRERDDKPNSKPDPDEDCRGFSAPMMQFLRVISSSGLTKPNRVFKAPYCFDVNV